VTPDPPALPPGRYLIDNSVWQRARHPSIAPLLTTGLDEDRLCAAGPLVAEALYSTRDAFELAALREELTRGLHYLESSEHTWSLAFDAMEAMAAHSPHFHRRPLPDYLVAALAHHHDVCVLHYDADFEALQKHSGLEFRQQWAAPRGSVAGPHGASAGATRLLKRGINLRLAQFEGARAAEVHQDVVGRLDEHLRDHGLPGLPDPLK